ncbi:MAG: response regulator [Proteobacteria bacterium]|nr:response regulator [Pseudomonadota bacterium]
MSISRSLTEAMGGTLDAHGRPGEGSTFLVTLRLPSSPVQTPVESAREPPEKAEPLRHHAPVLVAEDDPNNRRAMELMLTIIGVEAVCVSNGAEALEAVRTGSFELVLMDIRMPGMDGLEAIRAIRAWEAERQLPRTNIHVLSAQAFERDIQAARAAGADGYSIKPIAAPEIHALVRGALAMDDEPAPAQAVVRGAA